MWAGGDVWLRWRWVRGGRANSSIDQFHLPIPPLSSSFFLTVRAGVPGHESRDGPLHGIAIDAAVARDVGEEGLDVWRRGFFVGRHLERREGEK